MPSYSVVIPAYNGSRTIGATIRSVLAQTVEDFELIVVDDGSTDDSPEIAERFAAKDARVTVHRQANQGVAGARNTGVSLTSAPYVAFVDNDDMWMPGFLASMGRALDSRPRAGFAYTDAFLYNDGLARINRRTSFEFTNPPSGNLGAEEFLPHLVRLNFVMSSVACRRDAILEVGGFSSDMAGVDDWDLWLRMLAAGWEAAKADECVLVQRDRADSQSKDEVMMLTRNEWVLQRVLDSEAYSEHVHQIAEGHLAGVQRRLRRETSRGPHMTAIRARRKLLQTRDRLRPHRDWLTEPPPEVAEAFPEIARTYGRPEAR